jgi:ubiquinone/menaquinone biosynthesis C-methylase UbiE
MDASQRVFPAEVPTGDLTGLSILDVGCGDGWRFDLPAFAKAGRLIGVEPNEAEVVTGKGRRPHVDFRHGFAESLPCGDGEVDLYIAMVSLPYSNIPLALREANRVLKVGGKLHITMHDLSMQLAWLRQAVQAGALKRVLDHLYIFPHSLWFELTGRCFGRPWKASELESFQTQRRMRSMLEAAGFVNVRTTKQGCFLVEAVKR